MLINHKRVDITSGSLDVSDIYRKNSLGVSQAFQMLKFNASLAEGVGLRSRWTLVLFPHELAGFVWHHLTEMSMS